MIANALARSMTRAIPASVIASRPRNDEGSLSNPLVPITSDQLAMLLGGGPTAAGVPVGEKSGMRQTVVFACVSLIAGLLASLPLNLIEETSEGPTVAADNPLHALLHDVANEDIGLTAFMWRELVGVHMLTAGNHYSAIEFNGAGDPIGFVPLSPWATQVYYRREGMGLARVYRVQTSDGRVYTLEQNEVLHFAGLGFDGLKGVSPITFAGRQTIGHGLAMETAQARMLANGPRPTIIIEKGPGKDLSPDGLRELKNEFRRQYQGSDNAGEPVYIDAGMKATPVPVSAKDSELLESRKWNAVDIARIFRVPPFLIGETADMTAWGSGLESILTAFLLLTLNPWMCRIEAEAKLKLCSGTNLEPLYDRDALNAMNATARAELLSKRFQSGGMRPNDILRAARMKISDDPNAEKVFVPVNMIPIDRAGTLASKNEPAELPPEKAGSNFLGISAVRDARRISLRRAA
ncbi:MAG TPA: phage portal protein [Rhizomicrobium sp.]|jgi:HK97 family phage portal protein|nr:phage portal protein [Rhizomicrobium sp.]